MNDILDQLIRGIKETSLIEFIAVFFGIVSVIFSRMENVWVYPTGLINTVLYTYLCYFTWELYAESSVNIFYTVMSIYGWYLWTRKKAGNEKAINISLSSKKEWLLTLTFFFMCWIGLFFVLKEYSNSTVPAGDSFAGASAYAGMLLMARKKVESWVWWIITNIASVPLYFYKGAVFTSFQYVVFLILAIMGLITWYKKAAALKMQTHN